MAEPNSTPWWALIASAMPSVGVGAWTFMQWWGGRQDKREERDAARDTRRDDVRLREADAAGGASAALWSRMQADYARVVAERDAETTRADQWEDKARWWYSRCHDLRHDTMGARGLAEGLARKLELPAPEWPTAPDLPPLIEPHVPALPGKPSG